MTICIYLKSEQTDCMKTNLYSRLKLKEAGEILLAFQVEFIVLISIMALTSFLIYFLTQHVIVERENVIDYNMFLMVRPFVNPAGIKIAEFFSLLGTGSFLIPAYIFIIICLEKRNYRCLSYLTAVTATGSLLLGWLLKIVFHRSRPIEHLVKGAGGYSFPSGHALGGFIFSSIIIYLLWKSRLRFYTKFLLTVLIFLFGLFIGLSRIYLHVHYATDVIGSFMIAIWWMSLIHILFRLQFRKNISQVKPRQEEIFFPNDYHFNN
jgi:undecaprenyl-diphosphatase